MLKHLVIKNYALIQHLELSPSASLNIITGETGAGKSIILGAVALLLGNRADAKSLYSETEKCSIEGHFDVSGLGIESIFNNEDLDYEPVSIIRREISPQGKSRAFVNDTPVTLETLKKIGENLIEIHSQNETLALAAEQYQIELIDAFAQNKKEKTAYQNSYLVYQQAQKELAKIKENAAQQLKDYDYNNFQYQELYKAKIEIGQLDTLSNELKLLESAEDVKLRLAQANVLLYEAETAALPSLEQALIQINALQKYGSSYQALKERLQANVVDLKDLQHDFDQQIKNLDFDENRLEKLQSRINLLQSLMQKHHTNSEAELLSIQESLAQKLQAVQNYEHQLQISQKNLLEAHNNLLATAKTLSASRQAQVVSLQSNITELLAALGMPNAQFKIEIENTEPNSNGTDSVFIKFSANKGIAPQALKTVASGGEFSRLMLAIKYLLANKRSMPTIIFDEIDTGVSGEISIKVGKMMREMANKHQILAITHLHQIAAQSSQHYYVYKDHSNSKTSSNIKLLNHNERIQEIAQMIGGSQASASTIANAKEILDSYQ
jgi:DNA repair protein RecN (Recombination protein N)